MNMKIKYSSSKYDAKIVKNEFSHPRLEGERKHLNPGIGRPY